MKTKILAKLLTFSLILMLLPLSGCVDSGEEGEAADHENGTVEGAPGIPGT